nr:immunoglobulin light chain junction region [Macaca mulatta]MOW06711.1 immunoglobulin light chain junction region [Macaca mulatta]
DYFCSSFARSITFLF